MPFKNPFAGAVAVLLLVASDFLPESWYPDSVRYFLLGYLGLGFVLHAFAGYRRRRPYWNADSWRRYLTVSAIPVAALALMFTLTVFVDQGHPIFGAARSIVRIVWAVATIMLMVVGAGGIVLAVYWLHDGEASAPFSGRPLVRRGRPSHG